eukprot:16431050-Heterocapsa_arctica.AAC.1
MVHPSRRLLASRSRRSAHHGGQARSGWLRRVLRGGRSCSLSVGSGEAVRIYVEEAYVGITAVFSWTARACAVGGPRPCRRELVRAHISGGGRSGPPEGGGGKVHGGSKGPRALELRCAVQDVFLRGPKFSLSPFRTQLFSCSALLRKAR